jgi:hypothetical protein
LLFVGFQNGNWRNPSRPFFIFRSILLTHINTRITKYGKIRRKNTYKKVHAHFYCFLCFWSHVLNLFFFLLSSMNFGNENVLKFVVSTTMWWRRSKPACNQHYFVLKQRININVYRNHWKQKTKKRKQKGNIGSLDIPFTINACSLWIYMPFFPLSSLNNTPTKQTNETTPSSLYIIIHARTLQFCYKGFKYAAVPSHCQKTM